MYAFFRFSEDSRASLAATIEQMANPSVPLNCSWEQEDLALLAMDPEALALVRRQVALADLEGEEDPHILPLVGSFYLMKPQPDSAGRPSNQEFWVGQCMGLTTLDGYRACRMLHYEYSTRDCKKQVCERLLKATKKITRRSGLEQLDVVEYSAIDDVVRVTVVKETVQGGVQSVRLSAHEYDKVTSWIERWNDDTGDMDHWLEDEQSDAEPELLGGSSLVA